MLKLNTWWKKAMPFALILPLAVGSAPQPAKADNPVAVAVIGAVATVGAAAIGAGAAVAVAVIAGAVDYATSGDDEDDKREKGGDGGGASTERNRRRSQHIGEEQLVAELRPYVDRNIKLTASETQSTDAPGTHRVAADASYRLEGNVLLTPDDVPRLNLHDGLTFRFDVSNLADAKGAPITLNLDQLALSTQDIPKTHGYVDLRFIARQDGRQIWTSTARVEQGQRPTVTGHPAFQAAALDDQTDRLVIEALSLPIPYVAPGFGKTTRVEVEVKIEAEGART